MSPSRHDAGFTLNLMKGKNSRYILLILLQNKTIYKTKE